MRGSKSVKNRRSRGESLLSFLIIGLLVVLAIIVVGKPLAEAIMAGMIGSDGVEKFVKNRIRSDSNPNNHPRPDEDDDRDGNPNGSDPAPNDARVQ